MIHVDRSRVSPPPELSGERAARVMEEARAFYGLPPEKRAQRRFDFSKHIGWLRKIVTGPLLELFHGKCAFCESRVGATARPDLEQFRPKGGSVGLEGERSPDHYWWLAFDWQNLYPACPACNRTKGGRFPVRGDRSPLEATWDELRSENALLLDPCVDRPEEHLVFAADGAVAAVHLDDLPAEERDRFGTPTRGQVTIDTFGLNRSGLKEDREREATQFLEALSPLVGKLTADPAAFKRLTDELLAPDVPFLLMKQQLLTSWSGDHVPREDRRSSDAFTILEATERAFKGEAEQNRAFEQQAAWEDKLAQASVEAPEEAASYRARTSYIERVEIHGFTSMRDFQFAFVNPEFESGGDAPWLMLLGENGVGKTSVLKAIALALAGARRLRELEAGVPMQDLPGLFEDGGYVRVFLTSHNEPLEIRRTGDILEYAGKASGAKVFLRAFGPSRWFPLPGAPASEADEFVRVENLFNPFVPLESPEPFLSQLDPELWDEVAASFKDLLQISTTGQLSRVNGDVHVHAPGVEPTRLRTLSSGYEAVVAMAADLMHLLFQRWRSPRSAEGIVLLDEIGAHLHPRWKMRIVESLRRTFPRVQFVATTHEPLCLRGLRQGEILVMRRDDEDIVPFRPAQDVAELRIDQLLTSRMFGLYSTLEPELEAQFDRYYELLSRHDTGLDADDRRELEELRGTVGGRGILGSTRRDQLIYQIIDEFIAKEVAMRDEAERASQERLTKEQVAQFWSKVETGSEGLEALE